MLNVQTVYKGYKPLSSENGNMIFYSCGSLWKKNAGGKMESVVNVFTPSFKDKNRLASRLFRREPKWGAVISEGKILLAIHKQILLVDLISGNNEILCSSREGFSDPLNVCTICVPWLAIWGDYGQNATHDAVNIYGLTRDYQVETVFQFHAGEIRHIHNIIPCLGGGFYILTGDNEKTAGIYKASEDFKTVNPILVGSQQYRAVVGFDTPKGLLYATDSVNEPNHIYLYNSDGLKIISNLNGSCIYGTTAKGKYYFSTTVEPDERQQGLFSWFSYQRGKGILSNHVQIIEVNDEMFPSEVLRLKKDTWPMKLMQYGSIQFPNGNKEELWIYPVAVKKYDGKAMTAHGK